MNIPFNPGRDRACPSAESASDLHRSVTLREALLRRELACLLQERDALRSDIAAMSTTVSRIEAALGASTAEAERLQQELAGREQMIAAMYASGSWRLAAPARCVSLLLRRLLSLTRGTQAAMSPRVLLPAPAPALPAAPAFALGTSVTPEEISAMPRRRGEILVTADFLPLFDQQSGGLRLKSLIDMMGEAGWSIAFGSVTERASLPGVLGSPEGRTRYEDALRVAGVSHFLYGLDEIDSFLVDAGQNLDWAFLSFCGVATEVMPLVRSRCPTTRVVFDMVDFHGLRLAREAALRSDPELLAVAERQRAIELACATAADVTLAVTAPEKAMMLELVPEAVVEVLPNVFHLPRRPPPGPAERSGLFFVGGFWHQPNGDAMCWFVERIWPLIRREEPNTILRIAGSNPGDEVLALGAQPGVEVLGFVPDLTPLFDRHRVFIAPLRYGAGMKGKVGQSLVHGLPVVATAIGAEGMELQDGTHLLIADQEDAFAAHVLSLLRDDALWSRLSAGGRTHIERTLSVEVVRKQLEAVLSG